MTLSCQWRNETAESGPQIVKSMITIVEYNKQAKSHVILTGVNWREFKPNPTTCIGGISTIRHATKHRASPISSTSTTLAIQDCVAMCIIPNWIFMKRTSIS